jgi:hypothetical protein
MNELMDLLNNICTDIRQRNMERSNTSIPQSHEFFEHISRKYRLVPFAIPKLIKILVDSHKIFQFKVVEADRNERIRRIDGFVVTEGNVVKSLFEFYSEELVKEYSHEFARRQPLDKILRECTPKINDYNNTPLGKAANIVINLMSCQSILERNIMEYGSKWQESRLRVEVEKCDPIDSFQKKAGEDARSSLKKAGSVQAARPGENLAADSSHYNDIKKYVSKHSIEKSLLVYGVELYTRVCFRDNQYMLIQKLVEDGIIADHGDLRAIKSLIQKERINSDTKPKLQEYALAINDLEKAVNQKLNLG